MSDCKIRVGSVKTRIPRELTFDLKWSRISTCEELLNRFRAKDDQFLQSIITCDETWLHYFTPEKKREKEAWNVSPPPKQKARQSLLLERQWELSSVHVAFLKKGSTFNAQYYFSLLKNAIRNAICKKRLGKLSQMVTLLHDNAKPHMEM